MINNNNVRQGTFFTCDQCGKEYTFTGAFLVAMKGQKYRRHGGEELLTAEQDLCRDCAGQSEKFMPGVEEVLKKEISIIEKEETKCKTNG